MRSAGTGTHHPGASGRRPHRCRPVDHDAPASAGARLIRAAALLCAALLLARGTAVAQSHPNLDFEDGFRGWTTSGDAFGEAPIDAVSVERERFPASPLGGDYCQDLRY